LSDIKGADRRQPLWDVQGNNSCVIKLCADSSARGSVTLDPATVHILSNQLAVILGFVELVLADAAADDPHRSDLLEVRAAALAAANILGKTTQL
jgi:hypothetical protein